MSLTYAVRHPLTGNLLQNGLRIQLSAEQITTFAHLSDTAQKVTDFYSSLGISVNPSSELAKLLKHTHSISKEWAAGKGQNIRSMIAATHAMRIVESIMAASKQPTALEILRRIARNDVDLAGRRISQGKDALWEIELFLYLTRKNIAVRIGEPDLIVEVSGMQLPIACKKIYSMSRVEGNMSKGVSQLAALGGGGIVALNIDHLLPEDTILCAPTLAVATDKMHDFIMSFLKDRENKIRRFIQGGRCDGVLVSATAPADIGSIKPRINSHTQTVFWSPPSWLTDSGRERVAAFRNAVGGVVVPC